MDLVFYRYIYIFRTFNTASLAYGIYDKLYQVMAKNWNIQNKNAMPVFFQTSAAIRVRTKKDIATIVEMALVGSNIFFNCLSGPIRKHMLDMDVMFPKE